MLSQLKTGKIRVGAKQSAKAVKAGNARLAFVSEDADPMLTEQFARLCADAGVEIIRVPTMAELGKACGIEVGAAIAVSID